MMTEEIYLAGGCLWGVQAFVSTLPGVVSSEAGRANGTSRTLDGDYDGYAECVRTQFNPSVVSVGRLMAYLFEIIDPYSLNKQGPDVGQKYRTGVYSTQPRHLDEARAFIAARSDAGRVVVEVLPLTNYVRSADEHQDRLMRCPEDVCHIPVELLNKYGPAAWVNTMDDAGVVGTHASSPAAHAEVNAQAAVPGAPMSRVWGWLGPKGSEVWREIPICASCQGKFPPSQFPPNVKADPGPWGRT